MTAAPMTEVSTRKERISFGRAVEFLDIVDVWRGGRVLFIVSAIWAELRLRAAFTIPKITATGENKRPDFRLRGE